MLGASALEMLDYRDQLATAAALGWSEIAIGFVVFVRRRARGDPPVRRLRQPARFRAVRLVPDRRRRRQRSRGSALR
jgi:hypothetical protein